MWSSRSAEPGSPGARGGAADGTLRLWDLAQLGHPVPLGPDLLGKSGNPLYTAAFSPDRPVLAAARAGRQVLLWNVADPSRPVRLGVPLTGPGSTVYSVALSPDGDVLAAGSADDTVRLSNVTNPAHPAPLGRPLTGARGYVESVASARTGTCWPRAARMTPSGCGTSPTPAIRRRWASR